LSEKYSVAILFILLIALSLNLTTVLAQLTIRPDTLPNAVIGQFYSIQLYTEPKRTVDNWEISSGSLPPGLTLSKQDAYNAVISGTPSSIGTYQFTVKARITVLGQPQPIYIYKDYTINVEGLAISPDSLPEATENSSYGATIQVTGGTPPYSWDVTGLSTERTNITWQVVGCCPVGRTDRISIYGTPLIGSHGEYSVTIRVRDNRGLTASKTYTLRIKEVPWRYSVTISRLTERGTRVDVDESGVVVYLDELVFDTSVLGLEKTLFEVTVRRISGVGNRTFSVTPCFVTAEGDILNIPGIVLSPPCMGVVGSKDLVCTVAVQISANRYPYLSEERDFRLRIITDCEDPTPAGPGGRDVKIVTVSFKGISMDVRVWAAPVQVLIDDSIPLVEGKSTIFKIDVEARCSRAPKIGGMYVDIYLSLPLLEWDWTLYDSTDGTFGFVHASVYLDFGYTLAHATVYLPEVHSPTHIHYTTDEGVLFADIIGDEAVYYLYPVDWFTVDFPQSTPRPRYIPIYQGYSREAGTVGYGVVVETSTRVRVRAIYRGEATVVQTKPFAKPFRIMIVPCAPPYIVHNLETYIHTRGIGSISALLGMVWEIAEANVEFLQAVFPTGEMGMRYTVLRGVVPIMDVERDSCQECWFAFRASVMADTYGYDFIILLELPSYSSSGSAYARYPYRWPPAFYEDIPYDWSSRESVLAQDIYYALDNPNPWGLGNINPWDISFEGEVPSRSHGEGYWVNKGTHIDRWAYTPWIGSDEYRSLINLFATRASMDPMVMCISGIIHQNGTGQLNPIRIRNATWVSPTGLSGNYSIVLLDSKGVELSRFGINATFWGGICGFIHHVPFSKDIGVVELRDSGNRVLDRMVVSANRPQVKVLTPRAGEIVSNLRRNFTISWEGRDADGDKLYYTVLISLNRGESWLPIDIRYFDITTDSVTFDPRFYNTSEDYMIKVIVSDGFHSGENVSGVFTIGPYVQLKVESPYGDTKGSGWYMVNETATFTVAPTQVEMEGFLGLLGGYYEFAGWSGDSSSTSPSSTIMMNNDKTVIAVFKPNYTMPILCLAIVVVITLLVLTIILRRKQRLPPPP
jgi:hypothetical protein